MRDPIFNADEPHDALATGRLLELLASGTKAERSRAMGALARRAGHDVGLWDECLAAIESPSNRELRFMGSISIAHIGAACLWSIAPTDLRRRLRALIDRWPEPDRGDLLWFLRSQDLTLESSESSETSTLVRKLYQTLCDENQPETVRAEAHVRLLAVAGISTIGTAPALPLYERVDWPQIDRIVRENGAAKVSERSAEVTEVSYGKGADEDPINDGRILVTVRREGTFTVVHVHGPRRVWHGTLTPGAWRELLGAMELDDFPALPKSRVGLIPGTTFIDIAWRRHGELEQIAFPSGTPKYRDVSKLVTTIVGRVDAALGIIWPDVMELVASVQQEPIDPAVEADYAERAAQDLAEDGYTTRRCLTCGGEFVVKKTSSTHQVICSREQRAISTRAISTNATQ